MSSKRKDDGPIIIIGLFLYILLASCTKEYSRECSGCLMTTEMWKRDKLLARSRQTQPCYSGKGDTTYYRGDTLFTRKMVCK